jgi:ATP-dependent protease HslVU (ClpYQ) peptidase subunit
VTCIVGIEYEGTVTIGGDSAAVEGNRITVRSDEKVFVNGSYLIGFCDSFRMGQLLRYKLTVPKQKPQSDDFQHMATVFIDSVRKCFLAGGFAKTDQGEESGGVFLVGYKGALYCVDSDFHIGRASSGYEAIGCGEEFAIGSISSTTGKPERRVLKALTVAEQHSTGVCGPFTVLTS